MQHLVRNSVSLWVEVLGWNDELTKISVIPAFCQVPHTISMLTMSCCIPFVPL